eukprot:COSAG02_NODE_677_length_18591_cov_105.949221_3_plen_222_part_00
MLALTPCRALPFVSVARFPGDLLPRVLGSQIGATLLLALLNNARNQLGESLLLRADGPGRPLWLKEFSVLLDTLAGKLGLLLAHAEVRNQITPSSFTAFAYHHAHTTRSIYAPCFLVWRSAASTHELQPLRQSGYSLHIYTHCFARAITMLLCSARHIDQVDNVSRALKPAETDLLWNFLVEVALNADDTQRKRLHDELSPGLANVQVRARGCDCSFVCAN